jgi:hypothetical protein
MPIINGQGRVAVRVTGITPAPSSSYLLDTYGGAAAAYSLRKLSNTYSGSAIRVRRSSDNTEQNIGFDGSGNLDTTALTSFVGAGNGFVTTWYDQSGNNINLTQSTALYQPIIVISGAVVQNLSKPSIEFGNINARSWLDSSLSWSSSNITSIAVVRKKPSGNSEYNYSRFYSLAPSTSNDYDNNNSIIGFLSRLTFGGLSPVMSTYRSNAGTFASYTMDTSILAYSQKIGGNLYIGKNSDTLISSSTTNSSINPTKLAVGASISPGVPINSQDSYLNGYESELIIWLSDQSSNRSGINSNINTYYSIYPTDSDAAAFVSAAGITDSTQQSAVNTLVTSLKSAGIWTKMKAIYPFVGGTATSHKFNLKDPRDLDAAYRLVFNGGWTHTSTGALPNGTNGYADTKLVPSIQLSQNNNSFGFYSRTEANGEYYDMGSYASYISVILARFGGNFYGANNDNGYDPSTNSSSLGLFISSRTGSTTKKGYRNSTEIQNSSRTSMGLPTASIYLGGISAYPGYSPREFAFSFIGDGLSSSDVTSLNTAVQAFQTTLGRQVA